jgi:hypothetical protein
MEMYLNKEVGNRQGAVGKGCSYSQQEDLLELQKLKGKKLARGKGQLAKHIALVSREVYWNCKNSKGELAIGSWQLASQISRGL